MCICNYCVGLPQLNSFRLFLKSFFMYFNDLMYFFSLKMKTLQN